MAGLGSRFVAALIDALIQAAVLLAMFFAVGLTGALGAWLNRRGWLRMDDQMVLVALALVVLATFLVIWGYYIFFEIVWNGQTPGKRLAGIRVLTTDGRPINVAQSLIRNLVRVVDFLPSSYMLGAVVMLLNRRSQRLGDLAAGTFVVKVRREAAPRLLMTSPDGQELPPQQAAAFTAEDVALAREFLLRRSDLDPERRRELAERIAGRLRARLGESARPEPAESLLARVASLRR